MGMSHPVPAQAAAPKSRGGYSPGGPESFKARKRRRAEVLVSLLRPFTDMFPEGGRGAAADDDGEGAVYDAESRAADVKVAAGRGAGRRCVHALLRSPAGLPLLASEAAGLAAFARPLGDPHAAPALQAALLETVGEVVAPLVVAAEELACRRKWSPGCVLAPSVAQGLAALHFSGVVARLGAETDDRRRGVPTKLFRTLSLGRIDVDLADFWTSRLLSSNARRRAQELVSKSLNPRTLKI